MFGNLTLADEMFEKSVCTLKAASKDDCNGEYMTESNLRTIKFDSVKVKYAKKYFPGNNYKYKSVDALLQTSDDVYFIEFKNGRLDGEERAKIREKLSNSLLLFSDILGLTFSKFRDCSIFILVYNKDNVNGRNKSLNKIVNSVYERSELKNQRFDFEQLAPFLVHDVQTYTKEEFEEFLSHQNFIPYSN